MYDVPLLAFDTATPRVRADDGAVNRSDRLSARESQPTAYSTESPFGLELSR